MKKLLYVFLVLLSAAAIIISAAHSDEIAKKDSKDGKLLNDLYSQYNYTNRKINDNISLISSNFSNKAGVFLVFDQLSVNLLTTVKPLLDQYGHTGIVVITSERLPGKMGNISESELLELIDSGWQIAVGFEPDFTFSDSASEQLDTYLSHMESLPFIKDNGINLSVALLTPVYQSYTTELDKTFKSHGINTLISNITENYHSTTYFTSGNDILKATGIEYNTNGTIQSNLLNKISNFQTTAIISRKIEITPSSPEDITLEKYSAMLEYISEYDADTLYIGGTVEYYQSKLSNYTQNREFIDEIILTIRSDLSKLEEIESQIDRLLTASGGQ